MRDKLRDCFRCGRQLHSSLKPPSSKSSLGFYLELIEKLISLEYNYEKKNHLVSIDARHFARRRIFEFHATCSLASAAPLPLFVTTFDVDRNDDIAGASACTVAPNDCSLRGAIIAANGDPNADPVIINLQPGTTYNLTLTNATQENNAATGDLDITTTLHSVTIAGGGSSGPNASIIDASALNTGNVRDRVFHITNSNITAIFQDVLIRNGKAADNGTSGASTDPAAQNTNRTRRRHPQYRRQCDVDQCPNPGVRGVGQRR